MKKMFRALLAALWMALLTVMAPASTIGLPAPALSLKDLEGKEINLAALKGKVVVVDFWATWCGPCLEEIPGYIELQKKYGGQGLVIIGISMDTKAARAVKKFVEAKGMNYPVVMGGFDEIDAFMGSKSEEIMLPTTFLIGRDGKIVHQKSGLMNPAAYEAIVKKAL